MSLLALHDATPAQRLDAIETLEEALHELKGEHPAALELTEHFCNGVYLRELFIPKGTTLIGEEHKEDHLNIVLSGEIEVVTGDTARTVRGGEVFISPAGTKRAGFAKQDTRWIVAIASDKTDGEEIRKDVIEIKEKPKLGDKPCPSQRLP